MKPKRPKSYEDDDFEVPMIGVGAYQSNQRSAGKPKTRQIGFIRPKHKVTPTARKKK